MSYPEELKYTKDHEWVRRDGDQAEIGITDYAQAQLGDVVFVELPQVGRTLTAGEVFGTIESVKAVSELFSPVAGDVVAVNDAVSSAPETVNSDPHATWLVRVKVSDPSQFDALLDAAAYTAHVG